jgi:hypothetical protein
MFAAGTGSKMSGKLKHIPRPSAPSIIIRPFFVAPADPFPSLRSNPGDVSVVVDG